MPTVNPFFNSPTASWSIVQAFKAQSQASVLQSLTFFSGKPQPETASFSQAAVDSAFFTSLVQAGNTSLFSAVYDGAEAFNQSLLSTVSQTAGLHAGYDNPLIGGLLDLAA